MANRILLCDSNWEFLGAKLASRWVPHFKHEFVQPGKTYDPERYVICFDYRDVEADTLQAWKDQGFKIIINHLWDSYICEETDVTDNVLTLRSRNWMWINEHFIYSDAGLHDRTAAVVNPSKFFLMMLNMIRDHRDNLFATAGPYLADSLYSYVQRGHFLPDDAPLRDANESPWSTKGISNDRHYNPAWYTDTNFSLIAETTLGICRDQALCPPPGQRLFISEKTFKPFAFRHPFMTYGTPYTLQFLREFGFETFEHVIDESYDSIYDDQKRLTAIGAELARLHAEFKQGRVLFQDAVSQQKIQHNFDKFYDSATVEQLWITDVVDPVKNFINAQ